MADSVSSNTLGRAYVGSNGRLKIGSKAMGVDSGDLVDAALNVTAQKAKKVKDKVSLNQTRMAALDDFNTKASRVQRAVDNIRGKTLSATNDHVFSRRSVTSPIDMTSYCKTTVKAGADTASFNLAVNRLASNDTMTMNVSPQMVQKTVATTTQALLLTPGVLSVGALNVTVDANTTLDGLVTLLNNAQGTGTAYTFSAAGNSIDGYALSIVPKDGTKVILADNQSSAITNAVPLCKNRFIAFNVSGNLYLGDPTTPQKATLAITSDMTIADIAQMINDQTGTTGITATLMTVAPHKTLLKIQQQSTGTQLSLTDNASGVLLQKLGLAQTTGKTVDQLSSSITLDGSEIIRPSNTVNDAMTGVTFELLAPTIQNSNAFTAPISIGFDKEAIKIGLRELSEATKDFSTFFYAQTSSVDGKHSPGAILGRDPHLSTVLSSFRRSVDKMLMDPTLIKLGFGSDIVNQQRIFTYNETKTAGALSGNTQGIKTLGQSLSRYFQSAGTKAFLLDSPAAINAAINGQAMQMTVAKDGMGALSATLWLANTTYQAGIDTAGNITGNVSTPFEGYKFWFNTAAITALSNNASLTTTGTITQSAIDVFGRTVDGSFLKVALSNDLTSSMGSIIRAKKGLEAQNKESEKQIKDIEQAGIRQATRMEERWSNKVAYSNLVADSMRHSIDALFAKH